jgi:DNA-binding NarL/FixJ family response regulator
MDAAQAMNLVCEHADIGLILFDIGFPCRDGFYFLTELRERYPAKPVVIVSSQHDIVTKALKLGVVGYIPKSLSRQIVLSALRLVFAGGTYIPPEMLAPAKPLISARRASAATNVPTSQPADLRLTGRQFHVLNLMMQGKGNKAIARTLGLAEPTIKNHVTAILRGLCVTNRTEAVIAARDFGTSSESAELAAGTFDICHIASGGKGF